MKRKDVPCVKCSGSGELHGVDHNNDHGPWTIACKGCGEETYCYAYSHEAWKNWSLMNGGK